MAETTTKAVDLRDSGGLPSHTYAFYALRDLHPGEVRELLCPEDPGVLMQSVNLQLRNRLYWAVVKAGPPLWRLRVQLREDLPAASLTDLLTRDHARLDRLLACVLRLANRNQLAEAEPAVGELSRALRRHIRVENEILAPVFSAPRNLLGNDPTSIMLREHEQILEQLSLIESCIAGDPETRSNTAPLLALLSGAMAKHEHREEQNLFPNWNRALALGTDADGTATFLRRVQSALADRETTEEDH
ncbi:MAG: hemerythrin domain-containing protein [Gammaproteobacteria bacterium]